MDISVTFPRQKLKSRSKNQKWRRDCVDWAASRTYFNYTPVRTSIVHMKINYDLLNGVIHMDDVAAILNPGNISTAFIPDKIQHYPIINSKLFTLRGEEYARVFDWRLVVTNPFAVSDIEKKRKAEFDAAIQSIVEDTTLTEEQAQQQAMESQEYYETSWQDEREIGINALLSHYEREQNFKQKFNDGFMDACTVATEVYHCDIVGGEPVLQKMNPMKLRAFGYGYSDRIEDSDVIVYEDYWSRGRIIDTFYDELTEAQVKRLSDDLSDYGGNQILGAAGNYNDAAEFVNAGTFVGEEGIFINGKDDEFGSIFDALSGYPGGIGHDLLPYDVAGNVRVIQVWWKSKRPIYLVKSFDQETGNELIDFYPETYIPNEAAGEEAELLWINEAWEGTKIADDIYVRMRPCIVQHNDISNPSKCHFGIVGTVYNLNESKPYSLVDMMKPYNYLYDAVHAKLVECIATNWGKLLEMDLALKPKGWEVEKWMYFARANKVLIKDSFNEGSVGTAKGKLAGGLNNASKGYIDADWGNSIQNYINILQWTKDSMSELVGINRQREGNTYSRETVGGIERAVLQSSYITDWLFMKHDDTKRRVLDCYVDYIKAAVKGKNKKIQYILPDRSRKILELDGDVIAESSYGAIIDNSSDTQRLNQSLDQMAQAAMQNNVLDFTSLLKMYSTKSTQEKIKIIEKGQKRMEQMQQQAQQQAQQLEQQKIQAEQQKTAQTLQMQDMLNQRDNDTKIKVAELNAQAEYLRLGIYADENSEELRREEMEIDRDKLRAEIEQFDKELRMKDKELDMKKDIELKKIEASKQIAKNKTTTSKK